MVNFMVVCKMEDGTMEAFMYKQPGFCRASGAGGLIFYAQASFGHGAAHAGKSGRLATLRVSSGAENEEPMSTSY
jgi:hypothetical protein